jgi:hypothetical protein
LTYLEKTIFFFTLHLPEELNIADFNDKIRNAYIETVIDTVDIALKNNIPVINMHMITQVYLALPDRKIYLLDQYSDKCLEHIRHSASIISNRINENINIKICI